MYKKFSVTDVNVTFSKILKCVKPDTFIKKALNWYSNTNFSVAVPVAFHGFCVPSLMAFDELLSKAVRYACDSSELGFNGLNSVYTLKVSDTCILFLFVSYFADDKEWHITLDFTDRIWLEERRNASFANYTTEDTKDTTEDTKDTTEDTKDTTEDTKDTTEDTKDTTFLPVPRWFYQRSNIYVWSAVLSAFWAVWGLKDRRKRVIVKPVRVSPHSCFSSLLFASGYPYTVFC